MAIIKARSSNSSQKEKVNDIEIDKIIQTSTFYIYHLNFEAYCILYKYKCLI
jgi:hypothetical protein